MIEVKMICDVCGNLIFKKELIAGMVMPVTSDVCGLHLCDKCLEKHRILFSKFVEGIRNNV